MSQHEFTASPVDVIEELSFYVTGRPAPQGSKTPHAGGFHEASKYLPAWRKAVTDAGVAALAGRPGFPREMPLNCGLMFYLPRGRSVTRAQPTVPPDVDKLERAVFDALTKAGVWGDDAQVTAGIRGKKYADECAPGVRITVRSAE